MSFNVTYVTEDGSFVMTLQVNGGSSGPVPAVGATGVLSGFTLATFLNGVTITVTGLVGTPGNYTAFTATDPTHHGAYPPGSGSYTESASFNVLPTATITATPSTVTLGSLTTLTWTTGNATSASIDGGVGNVALYGSMLVYPTATTVYTITAAEGSPPIFAEASVTVDVQPSDAFMSLQKLVLVLKQNNIPVRGRNR